MKQLVRTFAVLVFLFSFVAVSSNAEALVSVKGYYRKDGTYVRPHYRTSPDSYTSNNFSTNGITTTDMSWSTAKYYEDTLRAKKTPKPISPTRGMSKREKKVYQCQQTGKTQAQCKAMYMKK